MAHPLPDWRGVDGSPSAWFDAPSLGAGADLVGRLLDLDGLVSVDVRTTGVRVGFAAAAPGRALDAASAAARELGLASRPSLLQQLSVVIESADPESVRPFWQRALDYAPAAGGDLADPLRRDPAVRFGPSPELRPLRNRVHLDVVRPPDQIDRAGLGEATGAYGVRHSDRDGNEVDLVPGEQLGDLGAADGPERADGSDGSGGSGEAAEPGDPGGPDDIGGPDDVARVSGTTDWQVVFSAMACYRVRSTVQQRDLVTAAAALAGEAGFPLLIDVRPGLVVLDSGKDQWLGDAHGLAVDFTALAGALQRAARGIGATPEPVLARFVQVFFDAADVGAVRGFWAAALGYVPDRRPQVTDIHDPRWLTPELVFQQLDVSDAARRRQRNRIHLEVALPSDVAARRVDETQTAGGRLLESSQGRWRLSDPEGNELVVRADSPVE
ncbi:VOC family protein [Barrientosiimonas humi]|uniref:VOC family protein n=1 Tax=Barrientosiimonas humi TaxID=999931 RepID=UPI00370D396B